MLFLFMHTHFFLFFIFLYFLFFYYFSIFLFFYFGLGPAQPMGAGLDPASPARPSQEAHATRVCTMKE
jgi:hypothetical protein